MLQEESTETEKQRVSRLLRAMLDDAQLSLAHNREELRNQRVRLRNLAIVLMLSRCRIRLVASHSGYAQASSRVSTGDRPSTNRSRTEVEPR